MTKNKKIGFWLVVSPWVIFILAGGAYLVCENIILNYFVQHPTTVLFSDGGVGAFNGSVPKYIDYARQGKLVAQLLGTINCVWLFFATWFGVYFLTKHE